MGVTGLWKLIEPCGQPVPLETLESKILAVDISIWLHQVIKGFQDNKGSALPNAHLLGLFHRLCKLLYYRVKPLFVFDGCVPQLKRDTIARRQLQRNKLNSEAERIQVLLLQSLAKEKVVQQALGANTAELLAKSPNKGVRKLAADTDDIFKLPEKPSVTEEDVKSEIEFTNSNLSFTDDSTCEYATTSTDESFDESTARHYYNSNLQAIDVKSTHFKALPPTVRHDILVDIKETRKQSSWGRLHELPAKGDDFSVFQMKRLLKRRAVQESIEEVQQEMCGRVLSFNELQYLLSEEDVIEKSTINKGTKKVSSDDSTRFLLVHDLNKKQTADFETINEENREAKPEKHSSSKSTVRDTITMHTERVNFSTEFDKDFELAIALSLEESTVYNEKDYDYDSDQDLKLNKEQSKELKRAAIGPARAFMIEYAGVNNDEILDIMEKTQRIEDFEVTVESENIAIKKNPDKEDFENKGISNKQTSTTNNLTNGEQQVICKENGSRKCQSPVLRCSPQLIDSTDSDSELEEVPISDGNIIDIKMNSNIQKYSAQHEKLEVIVDLTKSLNPEDDLFSDIFEINMNNSKDENALKLEPIPLEFINNKTFHIETHKLPINVLDESSKQDGNITAVALNKQTPVNGLNMYDDKIQLYCNSQPNVAALFDELKKQTEDVKRIKLEDIRLNSCNNLLSNQKVPENLLNETRIKTILNTQNRTETLKEVIEILDEECAQNKFATNSPQLKTPSKDKTITEFFATDYVIKRTPEAHCQRENNTTKVKSPFFINKNRSEEKESNLSCTNIKVSKATKSLFPSHRESPLDDCLIALDNKSENAEDALKNAACILKEQVSADDLKELASSLAQEKRELEKERNRQDRMGMGITQRMNSECQQLLRLFGIPYIVAPMEAEAQCAYLDGIGLTNGTITDDSDIWLFGGRTVYKNFFAQNKHVLEFRAENIEKSFNCDRSKLIQLACLVGSDYTTGIHGIGAVTAMEILATFCPKEQLQNIKSPVTRIITSLSKFRDWWMASKSSSAPPGSSARLALRKKLKNIELHEGFPNIAVVDAYLSPKVDNNKESFTWGFPDVESIREFARKTFGWTTCKTDEVLMPIIKKINEKKTQATIKDYFSVKSTVSLRQLKVSKRIQNAIDTMSGKVEFKTEENTKKVKPKRTQRKKRKSNISTDEVIDFDEYNIDVVSHSNAVPNKCAKLSKSSKNDQKKIVAANTKEEIPQRVKNLEEMRRKKENAAKILKKSMKEIKKGTK